MWNSTDGIFKGKRGRTPVFSASFYLSYIISAFGELNKSREEKK